MLLPHATAHALLLLLRFAVPLPHAVLHAPTVAPLPKHAWLRLRN
uniref:Uncharacterized protein n=1 Tax=Setaria italica TaxID=4555 RepID=K3ZFT9_SETIT